MLCKISSRSIFLITIPAWESNSFMYCPFMSSKIHLCLCLMVALPTRIFDSFMHCREKVSGACFVGHPVGLLSTIVFVSVSMKYGKDFIVCCLTLFTAFFSAFFYSIFLYKGFTSFLLLWVISILTV